MATENLAPAVISRIMVEIRDMVKHPPDGIRYVDNEDNTVSEIHGVIDGPEGTPYHGGSFRLKLVLSEEYPNAPPRGFFLTKIYHPNVADNGDICVNTLKKDWTTEVTLKHIFQVIRCLLIVPFPESSLNCEAGKLFMESYDEFARRARIMTEVHALPSADSGEGKMSGDAAAGADGASGGAGSSSGSGAGGAPQQQAAQKKKEKDAKKSLKRL